ncbi:Aspartyl protease family protein, partial [Cucurbita argyrosperma subsp. sororia]
METTRSLHPLLLLLLLPLLFVLVDARSSSIDAISAFHQTLVLNKQKLPLMDMKIPATECIFHKPRVEKETATFEMKERDYCSGNMKDRDKNLQDRLVLDKIHVDSLLSRFKYSISLFTPHGISDTHLPLTLGTSLQTLNYLVTVRIGPQNLTLIVDTGSDLTWVQCLPCHLCYNQQQPLFDPSNSPSFVSLPCNSSNCSAFQPTAGGSGACTNGSSNPCDYEVNYGDGSYSRGDLGFETLKLGNVSVENFIFGCGRNNKGLFGGTSGLMGFGRSELSVVSQTSSVYGGVFSYCLPSTETGSSGSLTMGAGDFSNFRNISPISYTKMVPNPQMSNFYTLNLTGITVGGLKLVVPRLAPSKGVLSLLDSGTVITRLPPSVYQALKEEFVRQFSGYPTAAGYSLLDTCYNLSGLKEVKTPNVKLHFEDEGVMSVDVGGLFYYVKSDGSQICLAFASLADEHQIGIIGSYQQKNQRVIYNLKESKVGFAGERCSF